MVGTLARLASGAGAAGGTAVVVAVQPTLLLPVLVMLTVLGALPLLLITTLALAAVYSTNPGRRRAAEKVLDRLLTTLRPR
jgi:nitrate/nitrite transporter NarK